MARTIDDLKNRAFLIGSQIEEHFSVHQLLALIPCAKNWRKKYQPVLQ